MIEVLLNACPNEILHPFLFIKPGLYKISKSIWSAAPIDMKWKTGLDLIKNKEIKYPEKTKIMKIKSAIVQFCIFLKYILLKEYLNNISELRQKTFNYIKEVIDKCNETQDFSCFDKMDTFETFKTFINCTKHLLEN